MANQFVARKGIIALADSQITGSLNISQNIVAGGTVQATFDTSTATAISGAFDSVSSSLASDISLNASSISSLNAASSSYLLNTTDTFTGTLTVDGTTTVNDTIAGNFTTNYDTKVLVGGEIIARSLTANESMVSIGGDSNGAFIKSGKQDGSLTDRSLNLITGEDIRLNIDTSGNLNFNTADGVGITFKESGFITIDSDNNDSSRNFQFKDGSGGVLMTLLDTGNVGIGETSPSSYGKLTVSDSSTNARIVGRGTYNSGVHYFTAQAFPTDINGGRVSIGSNALVQTAYSDAITRLDTTRGAWSWVFQTQNSTYSSSDKASLQYMSAGGTQSQRLSINASGKLAIGGDNTDGFLEVRQSDNTPSIRLNNGSNPNGAYYDILSNTGGNLYLSRNGSTVVTLSDTNGNVGIGTTDVNAKLRVVGGDVVVTGGKLGIGISSPRADITVDHVIDTLPNNTVDDTDAWNNTEKSHIFIEGTNNAMAIGISGGNNSRRGWLQVGHNNTSFANATGRLLLQPLGGLVGIGLYDAENPLHIKAATAEIKLESSDTGGGAGDVLGGIDIWGNDFSGTGRDSRAYIKAVYEDVFARTALTFASGPYNQTSQERMRIHSSGDITFCKTTTSVDTNGVLIQAANDGAVYSSVGSPVNTYHVYNTLDNRYDFYVSYNGTIYARNATVQSLSDQRLKENIQDLTGSLDIVTSLQPRVFDFKDGSKINAKGFVAQEVEQVLPECVKEFTAGEPLEDGTRYKTVGQDFMPYIVGAIKELKAENEALKARIQTLEGQ